RAPEKHQRRQDEEADQPEARDLDGMELPLAAPFLLLAPAAVEKKAFAACFRHVMPPLRLVHEPTHARLRPRDRLDGRADRPRGGGRPYSSLRRLTGSTPERAHGFQECDRPASARAHGILSARIAGRRCAGAKKGS